MWSSPCRTPSTQQFCINELINGCVSVVGVKPALLGAPRECIAHPGDDLFGPEHLGRPMEGVKKNIRQNLGPLEAILIICCFFPQID